MPARTTAPRSIAKKDVAASYNEFKEYQGHLYKGVTIGRGHKWYYDKGEWKDRKVTPDKWTIDYAVTKRRAGHAPEGSGAPVGTEYRWLILAHQDVKKLNADDYSTHMHGLKFKISYRSAKTGKWSASDKGERKRIIAFLQETIKELEKEQPTALDPRLDGQQASTKAPLKRKTAVRAKAARPLRGNGAVKKVSRARRERAMEGV
jgi:hypothetical protein